MAAVPHFPLATEEMTRYQADSRGSPVVMDNSFSSIKYGGRELLPTAMLSEPAGAKRRCRVKPVWAALVLLLATVAALGSYFGIRASSRNNASATSGGGRPQDGLESAGSGSAAGPGVKTEQEEDDEVGNPKAYPKSVCELPNYLSKNGHIVAVSSNGTEVPLKMKGINWFGMEASEAIPLGLWDNSINGTTVYNISAFLADNKFNSVRLPLMAQWILEDKKPNSNLINQQTNRAINVTSYMTLLHGIVKALQYRNIGVLLSMHTLTKTDKGDLWYNDEIPEAKFLESIDILTTNLCSHEYWNVMGLDLKNEPANATWGDGGATDFRGGAKRIADRMLKGCPKWLGFVEGIYTEHTMVLDGVNTTYYDWYGGGLQGARTNSVEFSVENKVVWAPHYYTPAVFPQTYFYGGGTHGEEGTDGKGGLMGYVELDDQALRGRIKATMDDMFGFLANETGPALVLGEFGGLYSNDLHPMKTTKRCTDFAIDLIKQPGWAGGFVWSLNPESEYQYNPADKPGRFFEGIMQTDWLKADAEYLAGMAAMDDMENLRPFPCFPQSV